MLLVWWTPNNDQLDPIVEGVEEERVKDVTDNLNDNNKGAYVLILYISFTN